MDDLEKFVEWFNKLDPEYVNKQNQLQIQRDLEDYRLFKQHLDNNSCYYCAKSMSSFDNSIICFHWLLRPKGVKKKDIIKVLDKYSLLQIRAYFRWLATAESFMKNINDLTLEQSKEMIVHETTKYRDFIWTLSCSKSDFNGHRKANFPHYHLLMKQADQVYFKFSGYHAKLKENDLFQFSLMLNHPDTMSSTPAVGVSVQNAMNEVPIEMLLENMNQAKDDKKAQFRVQTFITAPKGKTISGDQIAEIIETANKKNVPIAQAIKESNLDASVNIVINPSENIPENLHRNNPRKKKK